MLATEANWIHIAPLTQLSRQKSISISHRRVYSTSADFEFAAAVAAAAPDGASVMTSRISQSVPPRCGSCPKSSRSHSAAPRGAPGMPGHVRCFLAVGGREYCSYE